MKIKNNTLALLLLLFACSQAPKDNYDKDHKEGLITYYHKDGSMSQQTTYKNNIKDGVEKIYFLKTNRVRKEIMFVHGIVEGDVKEFYEDGKLYRVSPYKAGRKDGIFKTFYRSGALKSQISYRASYPGNDLKEFAENGTLLKQQAPSIVIEPSDRIAFKGEYGLRLSLSNHSPSVNFYEGLLYNNMFLHDDLIEVNPKNGIVEYTSYVSPGSVIMKKVNFVAVLKSVQGNPLIIQRTYNLAVQNNL